MPLIRRMPKRGFNNTRFAVSYLPVNVADLNRFEDGTRVDEPMLRSAGLAKGRADGIKVLGTGELQKKLRVCVQAFSTAAKAKIEAAGGSCEVVTRSRRTDPATESKP
jgi:large subunit ribosomal protein L15